MDEFTSIGLNKIGLRYSSLRVVFPRSEQQMFRSLKKYGQISPVIVGSELDRFVSAKTIKLISGAGFIGIGVWSLLTAK